MDCPVLKCPSLALDPYLLITEKSQSVSARPGTGSSTNTAVASQITREYHLAHRLHGSITLLNKHMGALLAHSIIVHGRCWRCISSVRIRIYQSWQLWSLCAGCWEGKASLVGRLSFWAESKVKVDTPFIRQWHFQCGIIKHLPSNTGLEHYLLFNHFLPNIMWVSLAEGSTLWDRRKSKQTEL